MVVVGEFLFIVTSEIDQYRCRFGVETNDGRIVPVLFAHEALLDHLLQASVDRVHGVSLHEAGISYRVNLETFFFGDEGSDVRSDTKGAGFIIARLFVVRPSDDDERWCRAALGGSRGVSLGYCG